MQSIYSSYAAAILVYEEEGLQSDVEDSRKGIDFKKESDESIHSDPGNDEGEIILTRNSSPISLKDLTLGEKMKRFEIDCPAGEEACLPAPPFSPGLPGLVSPLPPKPFIKR